jgi:hypothetical protein
MLARSVSTRNASSSRRSTHHSHGHSRNVPRDLMMRMQILAAMERTSVNSLLLRLAWDYVVQTRAVHGMTGWDIKRMNERGFPPSGKVGQETH